MLILILLFDAIAIDPSEVKSSLVIKHVVAALHFAVGSGRYQPYGGLLMALRLEIGGCDNLMNG